MISILEKDVLQEDDIKQLILLKVEESINLDFKQAESLDFTDNKKGEIAKDVSAFANSDGGFIIYGIKEDNHVADSLSYIDGNKFTKEWLEQVIQTRIQRKIEKLEIIPIRFDNDIEKSVYVVKIPESYLAPHMTSDKRFYKRFNFESVRMEEYEIRNLYNRKEKTNLVINNITTSKKAIFGDRDDEYEFFPIGFQIENIGNVLEKHFKLLITLNFNDYTLKFDSLSDSKPNHSLIQNNERLISFSNNCPIFPGEVMTIGNIDFGLPSSRIAKIIEDAKFKLKLIYSNGSDELDIDLKEIIEPRL